MKKIILLFLSVYSHVWGQWSTDLNQNLEVFTNLTASSNSFIKVTSTGKYFVFSQGSITGLGLKYRLHFFNHDGTPSWSSPIDVHSKNLGTWLPKSQCILDQTDNLITITSYDSGNGAVKGIVNKINPNGQQLWNGTNGIELENIASSSYLSPSNNLYLIANKKVVKISPNGVIEWSSSLTDGVQNAIQGEIIENPDGSISVAYFSPFQFNPTFGKYYISHFNNQGTRLTNGIVEITNTTCRFYDKSFLIKNNNNELLFIYYNTNSKNAFIEKIVNNLPTTPVGTQPYKIDVNGDVTSSVQSVLYDQTNNHLHLMYNYSNGIEYSNVQYYGIKYQKIDASSLTKFFPEDGQILLPYSVETTDRYTTTRDLIKDTEGNIGFISLNKDNKINYNWVNTLNGTIQSANICNTNSSKKDPSLSLCNQNQIVVCFCDDRLGNSNHKTYLQNYIYSPLNKPDFESENNFIVFPNPAKDILNIYSKNKTENQILIYDMLGKMVYLKKTNPLYEFDSIDISSLAKGTYLIEFISTDKKTTISWIKE